MFNQLHSSMNQESTVRKAPLHAIKIAAMTNADNFLYEGKPSHAIAKSTLFAVMQQR